jgi:hypothetical protein
MSDFWQFVIAVFWHWQSWAGGSGAGGAVVVLVAIYERLSGHTLSKRMYVSIFIFIFLVGAFFVAWREQYQAVQAAKGETQKVEKKLGELTNPGLVLHIDQLGIGDSAEIPTLLRVLIVANLTNVGAPSIAESWELLVVLPDGSKHGPFPTVFIDPKAPIVFRNPNFKLSPADALYNKTMQPIQKGDKKRGVLIFPLFGLERKVVEKTGTEFILSAKDVNDKLVSTERDWDKGGGQFQYYPGLEPPPR